MGDAIPLDAHRRVAQRGIVQRQLTEVGTALAHDHGHQVDGDRVEQAELEALTGDGAGRHGHGALLGDGLRLRDRGLHPVGDEVERGIGVGLDPVRRYLVGHDDHRYVHRVRATPSSGEVEQRAPAHKSTQPVEPLLPVLGAGRTQVEGDVVIDRGDLHGSVLQPVEEATDRVVVLRDVAVQRHRRGGDDLSHVLLLRPRVASLYRPSRHAEVIESAQSLVSMTRPAARERVAPRLTIKWDTPSQRRLARRRGPSLRPLVVVPPHDETRHHSSNGDQHAHADL